MKAVTSNTRKEKRYHGEESRRLTNAEQAKHDERMAQMKAGTYDFSNCLVDAPKVVCAFVVED